MKLDTLTFLAFSIIGSCQLQAQEIKPTKSIHADMDNDGDIDTLHVFQNKAKDNIRLQYQENIGNNKYITRNFKNTITELKGDINCLLTKNSNNITEIVIGERMNDGNTNLNKSYSFTPNKNFPSSKN